MSVAGPGGGVSRGRNGRASKRKVRFWAPRSGVWRQRVAAWGSGRVATCALRWGGDFVSQRETGWAGRLAGGGYHFRRRAVSPYVECASDGLQSGKACRVTRVGPRKLACSLSLGCGRPLKGRRGIPWRIHRQCSSPGKPCPLSAHRRLGERAGTNHWRREPSDCGSLPLPNPPPAPGQAPRPSPVLPVSSSTVPLATPPRPAPPDPTRLSSVLVHLTV